MRQSWHQLSLIVLVLCKQKCNLVQVIKMSLIRSLLTPQTGDTKGGCLIFISFLLLTNSITASPLVAQTVLSQQPPLPPPQDVVPPIEPIPPQLRRPETLPLPEDLLQPPTAPRTPAPVPGKIPQAIKVKKFKVIDSTVFTSEEFDKVLAPFINRSLSFTELFQARSAVTQLYIDRGYITSGALLPEQSIKNGIVTIQVVEGGLEEINVIGTRRLNPNYVRDRLPQSKPLNQNRLLEALQLLQLNPLIQNLSAELGAGSRPGTSVLEVRVIEAKTFNTQIGTDNGRSPSVGSFRRQFQINEANLFGLGDGISLGYSNTDGSNGIDASYSLPINPRNGTLSLSVGFNDSNVIEAPFDEVFDIDGNSRYYELTLRQPVVQTPNQEFALGLTAARRESKITEDEVGIPPFLLSPGADDEGNTRISAVQFFQEWTRRNTREVLAARSQFNLGISAFNATVNNDAPDSSFLYWRGQGQWVRLLAPDTVLLIRGDVQLSTDALVPIEQFGLGGQASVRGYRQDALLTDNGAFASAELRLPILRSSRQRWVLQLTPFIDAGTTWDNSGRTDANSNTIDTDTLASVGLGLRYQLGDRLTARFDWGIPLIDISSQGEDTWQENGLYFSFEYNPF